jgi:two-component system, response regulator PdtaR
MDNPKFIILGNDKKSLGLAKNVLTQDGYIFTGYSSNSFNLLRYIRNNKPDFVILEIDNNFSEVKPVLEVLDEELLSACVLILDRKIEDAITFTRDTRIISYVLKPLFKENILQICDMTLMNYFRIVEYEQKVKKLNETLESRKVVEKAKWILIEYKGCTENEAHELIRRKSRDNRIPMKDVAKAIILAHD